MSECHWIATGYGINEDNLCPSASSQVSFIKKYLPDQYEEMQGYIDDCTDCDMSNTSDYLDSCERWIEEYQNEEGYTGFGVLFAMAIQNNEDGFNPEYFFDNGCGAVMYEDRLPWEMSERVKNMKAEDMAAIFQKYLDTLGISAPIGRQSVEYYG